MFDLAGGFNREINLAAVPVTVPEPGLIDVLGLALTAGLLRRSRREISFDIKLLRG